MTYTPLWQIIVASFFSPLIVGLVLWIVGNKGQDTRIKADAIRDLMTFRGDFSSPEFLRALNKVVVVFHSNDVIREEIRHLYETINNPSNTSEKTKRSVVGLIYKLCQLNGFKGLTEYDIDQAFPENKQTPIEELVPVIQTKTISSPVINQETEAPKQ